MGPVIESQPGAIFADEMSLPMDKVSIDYRKWHVEFSHATQEGREDLEKSLLTDAIEPR